MSKPSIHRIFILSSQKNADGFWAFLKANWRALMDTPHPIVVEVTTLDKVRTRKQYKRYRAILKKIAADAWEGGQQFSPDPWAAFYQRKFIGSMDGPFGETAPMGTSNLDTKEMSDFEEEIMADASTRYGIEFIDPNFPEAIR